MVVFCGGAKSQWSFSRTIFLRTILIGGFSKPLVDLLDERGFYAFRVGHDVGGFLLGQRLCNLPLLIKPTWQSIVQLLRGEFRERLRSGS